jgi:hypothetical protein
MLCLVTYNRIKAVWTLVHLRGIENSGLLYIEDLKWEVLSPRLSFMQGTFHIHALFIRLRFLYFRTQFLCCYHTIRL